MSNKELNRLTKECLQTALICLMGEKPFDKISVSELVRRSGVSRTAFYRNYRSKEDILNELGEAFFVGLERSLSERDRKEDPAVWYYNFFQTLQKHESLFDLLLQAHVLNNSVFSSFSISRKLGPLEDSESGYRFLAWEGALSTVAVHWFETGMRESLSFMAGFCARVLPIPV